MRALVLAACLLALVAFAPAADAQPEDPPGGSCHVVEEYVTEASLGRDANGLPTVNFGAPRPIECYY